MFEIEHVANISAAINLRRLFILRNIVVVAQIIVISIALSVLEMDLPVLAILLTLSAYISINAVAGWQFKTHADISQWTFFIHVVLDVLVLSVMLYFSGGATNPFVSLMLLPLVIVATTLPRRLAWLMALITILSYTILMFIYVPLPPVHVRHGGDFNAHILGMWISFMVGAALIVIFIMRMAETLRERDAHLAQARERMLEDESLVALATLAAGAAHELSTPLATMTLVIDELSEFENQIPELSRHRKILRDQVTRCKTSLSRMSSRAEQPEYNTNSYQNIDDFINSTILQWQNMRPMSYAKPSYSGIEPSPEIIADVRLTQAIISLLNNAADASADNIEVECHWDQANLTLVICDRGSGLIEMTDTTLGQPFYTTKEEGKGLGLFLARAVVDRLGGTINLTNREDGGACARLHIPLARLRPSG